jgi:hypothetical protein
MRYHWVVLLRPLFRYSRFRDALVLRGIGGSVGPVLRVDRRDAQQPFAGRDRRLAREEQQRTRIA